eukprot:1216888-Karenia_brevis.AAC.1
MCDRGHPNQPWEAEPVARVQHSFSLVAGQYGGRKCDRGNAISPGRPSRWRGFSILSAWLQ